MYFLVLWSFFHACYGRRERSLHCCISAATVPSINASGERVRSLEQCFVFPIDFMDKNIKLDRKGTGSRSRTKTVLTDGQDSEIS